MAKLGMPNVIISFKEAGIAAIERSKRGIVFLVLEEDEAVITQLTTTPEEGEEAIQNPFTIYTIDDIPSGLSEDNKDYITKCLLGYVTAPYRVKVYLQATGGTGADKWQESLKNIAAERWDYLSIPKIEEEQLKTVGTWIKTNRENKYKKVKAVLPGYAGDYEGIVNFSNKKITTATKEYTPAEYTARIAGLIAGTPLTISATYAPLGEVIDCDKYDLDEMMKK